MNVTRRLAEHIAETRLDAIPEGAQQAARRLLLDTIGIAWAGASAPGIPEACSLAVSDGGAAESTILAYGHRLPASQAAFLNSSLAAALDYDSVHQTAQVHADIVCLPAALAVSQREHSTGKEFLAALLIGADLTCRLGMSTHRNSGWFFTSLHGVFGSAAAAARLLRLDAERTCHALGIALSLVGGTQQALVEKSLTKRLQAGFAARGGVVAALLASRGVTGPTQALEGKFGFYEMYESGNPEKVLEDLGEKYEVLNTTIKKYPSCTCNHTLIEGVLSIMNDARLSPTDVESVEVFISPFMNQLVGAPFDPRPNPQVTAQFSAQYSVACAILRRRLGIAEIQEEAVLDPAIADLASRVQVTVDEASTAKFSPTKVVLRTRHGVAHARITEHVPGTPESPMSDAELAHKFSECTAFGSHALPPEKATLLANRLKQIDDVDDMANIFEAVL